jgi:hypothetical protein
MPQSDKPGVSVVVAMRDEAAVLDELLARLEKTLLTLGPQWEVIAVDDGSADGTWGRLKHRAEASPWLRGIRLARPFGQHPATIAGLQAARGDVLVTIDADLEVFPEDIPALMVELDKGYDVVFGTRTHKGEGFVRERVGQAVKRFLARFAAGHPPEGISTFLAARRDAVAAALRFDVARPVTPFHVMLAGPRASAIAVREKERSGGRSKYGLARLAQLSSDIFFGYATIVDAALVGVAAAVPAGTAALWVLAAVFASGGFEGMSAFWAVAGAVWAIFSLAVLLVFVAQIVLHAGAAQARPLYIIRETF